MTMNGLRIEMAGRGASGDRTAITRFLAPAGIAVDGNRPGDIRVHDDRCFQRFLAHGTLGLGESYMDGWWDCKALDVFTERVLRAGLDRAFSRWALLLPWLRAKLWNLQHGRRAYQVGEVHYDLGDDLFEAMLDRRMVYSCAYWKDARDLDEAEERKLDLVCRKLGLERGMRVLDIGCGWGGFAAFAAERYGVEVLGITISRDQVALGRERCAGLPVEICLQDYRELTGRFDRVVSIGMFEHVGPRNYGTFMRVARRVLDNGGLFLLHTIGATRTRAHYDPWTHKYIFPNGHIPSMAQIDRAMEGLFVMEDWHNIGPHYDRTLMAWHENFERHWPRLRARYDERFHRMWRYYLLTCAGSFRARHNQVWQMVMSKDGVPGGYTPVR